ncbi:MAG: PD-(D/E)XK nuclease family protein, partial [Elusimicrobiota bacterium]
MKKRILFFLEKLTGILNHIYSYFFRGRVTMSHSRYNMYNICPLKYKLYYEDGLKNFPSSHLHLGSVVHAALKEYHEKFDMKGKQGTLSDLLGIYQNSWDEVKEEMI